MVADKEEEDHLPVGFHCHPKQSCTVEEERCPQRTLSQFVGLQISRMCVFCGDDGGDKYMVWSDDETCDVFWFES